MAHLLGGERLHLRYPTRTVFEGITVGVHEGDRIGIVGRNGDGKSSLLGMLAGLVEPNEGKVTMRGGVTIGVLSQQDTLDPGATVAESVVGDRPEYEWAGETRTREIIAGLLGDLDWSANVESLSGGQRRRVSLAKLLTGDWDILMLDEPTNHLDVEAIAWLAEHLKRRWPAGQGALLTVTHDRWFLDEVCTATWEVHDGIVEPFEGGYAAYILQRVERDRQAATIEQKRQNLARKELAWLRRGAPARTAKPKFRIEAANELIADVPEVRDATALKSLAVARLGKDVVDLVDVGVSFDDREVLRDVEWRLAPGERTGILGVNGSGKSTLLSLITGTLEPTSGTVKRGKTVEVRTLTQRIDELEEHLDEPVRTVVGRLRQSYTVGSGSKAQDLSPSQLLEQLGFRSEQLSTRVKDLSGGQQRRLQLLLVLLDQPNVLILDEPTNDMDTDMLSAMEDLLDTWPGTLIVVSHDRYFLERVTDQQYALIGQRLRHLPGGVDEYLSLRAAEAKGQATAPASAGAAASAGGTGSARGSGAAGGSGSAGASASSSGPGSAGGSGSGTGSPLLSGAERRTLEKELQSIERKMQRLSADADAKRTALAELDQSDFERLGAEMATITDIETEAATLEERWLELSEQLEA
ncbi:ABC-F family ATP-binding cassette domain-containing protein [Leucobacter chinensis]|uniref:ABC-F family ATP-binding cassette domain-containing protein n=1 Tax=Leucobacter chinensis TaxID=2851010 RepID=UPI001C23C17B|nr:ABC-F family ATP-binding cassette domain-containing protein [Leucobacter chinensis]